MAANPKGDVYGYGVVIDFHAIREDRGVPGYFDGWYATRALAEEALRHFASRSPGARAHLVACITPTPR
jgi:hypothetical protein